MIFSCTIASFNRSPASLLTSSSVIRSKFSSTAGGASVAASAEALRRDFLAVVLLPALRALDFGVADSGAASALLASALLASALALLRRVFGSGFSAGFLRERRRDFPSSASAATGSAASLTGAAVGASVTRSTSAS